MTKLHIRTHFEYPPIPTRNFDWCAVLDGYEPGDRIGWGPTTAEAIDDLLDQLEDDGDYERPEPPIDMKMAAPELRRTMSCPICLGHGVLSHRCICHVCDGAGRVPI